MLSFQILRGRKLVRERPKSLDGCVVLKFLTNYTRTFDKDWNMAKVQRNEKLESYW